MFWQSGQAGRYGRRTLQRQAQRGRATFQAYRRRSRRIGWRQSGGAVGRVAGPSVCRKRKIRGGQRWGRRGEREECGQSLRMC